MFAYWDGRDSDWADEAVFKIVQDLSDRRGLKWAWEEIDEDVQLEIHLKWAEAVRNAL